MTSRRTPTPDSPDAAPTGAAARIRNTINDVARLAGVSKKTVSRVINESPLVRADTRARVLALMDELGYSPDPQARGLAFRRSFLVGMVFDSPSPQYVVHVQYGILDVIRETPYELLVHPCDSRQPGYIDGIRKFVQQQKLHGVILVPRVSEDQALADLLDSLGCRHVRVAPIRVSAPAGTVHTQDREAGAAAARHLHGLGHREFGLITGPAHYRSAIERAAGFTEEMAALGLPLPPERVATGGYTFESGVAGAETLFAGRSRPTAIFACNDEMAAGVYVVAHRLGLAIPDDVSVVGYDDSTLASQLGPALTTLRLPVRQVGQAAARMLLAPDSDDAAHGTTEIMLDLIVRDSTCPPRPRDSG